MISQSGGRGLEPLPGVARLEESVGGTMSRPDDDSSPSSREAAFTRRSLLIGAATTVVGVAIGCRRGAPPRRKGTIVGPGRFVNTDTGKMSFVLCLFDLDGPGSRSIDMDFFGHGLALDPRAPGRAVMFEKKGLFATENNLDTKDGLICVRDARTFRELGQFPTYGKSPHDCHLIDEGRTLAITNGGSAVGEKEGAPSVTFVDAVRRSFSRSSSSGAPGSTRGIWPSRRSATWWPSPPPATGSPRPRGGASPSASATGPS